MLGAVRVRLSNVAVASVSLAVRLDLVGVRKWCVGVAVRVSVCDTSVGVIVLVTVAAVRVMLMRLRDLDRVTVLLLVSDTGVTDLVSVGAPDEDAVSDASDSVSDAVLRRDSVRDAKAEKDVVPDTAETVLVCVRVVVIECGVSTRLAVPVSLRLQEGEAMLTDADTGADCEDDNVELRVPSSVAVSVTTSVLLLVRENDHDVVRLAVALSVSTTVAVSVESCEALGEDVAERETDEV